MNNYYLIGGNHLSGKTHNDVTILRVTAGQSKIIPRLICESFKNLREFYIHVDIGIVNLTENAMRSCVELLTCEVRYNPVVEIHPNFLRYNVKLTKVKMTNYSLSTYPEQLFSTTTKITWLDLCCSMSVTDLPAKIFDNLSSLTYLYLHDNRLSVWRQEWTQKLTNLNILWLHNNQNIAEVPRNGITSNSNGFLMLFNNKIQILDFFMIKDIQSLRVYSNPLESIDFNLVERMTSLNRFDLRQTSCANRDFTDFQLNREAYMLELEPCFEAFDRRILG